MCKSESNCIIKAFYMNKWQERWSEDNSPLKEVQKSVHRTFMCKLNNRKYESILHRLRMGNIGLNANLHVMNMHETGMCPRCPSEKETVHHYLCVCPCYIIERAMLFTETGVNEQNMTSLLNSTDVIHQQALVDYVLRTNRFYLTL